MMMEDGFAAFGAAASSRTPLPQEAWQLKPRQASKRKHDGCDWSPPSEGEDFTSPDSTTASLSAAPKPSQSAQETTTATKSSMLSPFLGGMSMSVDATPGSRMTDRMGSRGMTNSAPPTATACNFSRRQGKSASFAPLAPGVPRSRPTAGLLSGLPTAVPRNRWGDRGGSMMSD